MLPNVYVSLYFTGLIKVISLIGCALRLQKRVSRLKNNHVITANSFCEYLPNRTVLTVKHSYTTLSKQQGLTLVELLVTTAITLLGLVGSIAMQATAKQNSINSQQRFVAMYLANDIVNRIQHNASKLNLYKGYDYGTLTPSFMLTCKPIMNNHTGCTTTELAQFDKQIWNNLLLGEREAGRSMSLTQPVGCIDYQSNLVFVVVSWLGQREIQPINPITLPQHHSAVTLETVKSKCGSQVYGHNIKRRNQVAFITYLTAV